MTLKELYENNPIAKFILDHQASGSGRELSVRDLRWPPSSVLPVFRAFNSLRQGTLRLGRRGFSTRLEWSLVHVNRALRLRKTLTFPFPPKPKWHTVAEAVKITGSTEGSIRGKIRRGSLESKKEKGQRLVRLIGQGSGSESYS